MTTAATDPPLILRCNADDGLQTLLQSRLGVIMGGITAPGVGLMGPNALFAALTGAGRAADARRGGRRSAEGTPPAPAAPVITPGALRL